MLRKGDWKITNFKRPFLLENFKSFKRMPDNKVHSFLYKSLADERKILLLFSQQSYPEIDPEPERKVLEDLRHAIFTDTDNLDPHTVVLVSLAHSAGLLPAVFDKKDLKARRDRIERIVNGDALGQATKEAIEAVQAAVMVACILPAITAATVTN